MVSISTVSRFSARQALFKGIRLFAMASTLLAIVFFSASFHAPQAYAGYINKSDVAPVWSVTDDGDPVLLTNGNYQYVAYYDQNQYLTIAQRVLPAGAWIFKQFTDIQATWQTGLHAAIAMQIDSNGMVHVSADMHDVPLKYYRMTRANDMTSFQRYANMVGGPNESLVTYPIFFKDSAGVLYFTYRTGSSGDGNQIIYSYDAGTQSWTSLLSTPLLNGIPSHESAYEDGPVLGPDGYYHLLWMWRNTPDVSTDHDLSYMRSKDLVHWETINGSPLTLPVTPTTPGVVVDPVPVNGGLFNAPDRDFGMAFDAQNRLIVSYTKYDAQGYNQVYNATFATGQWQIVQASNWQYRWNIGGVGSQTNEVFFYPLTLGANGTLLQRYSHIQYGSGAFSLDGTSLQPLATLSEAQIPQYWPEQLNTPQVNFPTRPMIVDWLNDAGSSGSSSLRYVLRWEHGPNNNDAPVAKPWPASTILQIYALNPNVSYYTSSDLALGKTVTASSSYESSGWGKQEAVDGILDSSPPTYGWSSNSSLTTNHTEWVAVDLGSSQSISQVDLYPRNDQLDHGNGYGFPIDFTIQISTDNLNWTTVVNKVGYPFPAGEQTFQFAPINARYVKITGTNLRPIPYDGNQYRMQLAEIEVLA